MAHRSGGVADAVCSNVLHHIAAQQLGMGAAPVTIRIDGLGGLEAGGVSMVAAHAFDATGRRRSTSFVVKPLGLDEREAAVYRWLAANGLAELAPRLIETTLVNGRPHMVLERVRPAIRWPWRDPKYVAGVVQALARLHAADVGSFVRDVPAWGYREEISGGAHATLTALATAVRGGVVEARALRPASRIAEQLDEVERRIATSFPLAVLHGDAHSGNAIMRAWRGWLVPALVDWQRARIGSPLEDLCSWLQSLACWEPIVRQRHESLMRQYLAARGCPDWPGKDLRDAYWLAGARNAFAGALRYHLAVMTDPAASPRARARSQQASRDWLRIIRRATLALD